MEPIADEAALIARAWDADAFQALARRYYRPLGAFLLRKVGRPDLAEDLVQETFLEAFRALQRGARPRHFSSWLFGIAKNRAGKSLRRKSPTLFDPADPPATPTVDPDSAHEEMEESTRRLADLDAALAQLPEETRDLLRLKHERGLTCEEIAAELRRPVGTIKSLLSRTYRQLRDRLAPAREDPT